MSPAVDLAECVERLLHGFTTYDRAVDVVSVFEMAFTTSRSEVPGTVRHFERFPRVPGADGATLTPDFTVVFEDGSGLVGEIARLALHENSAESLCRQITKYDALRQLPDADDLTDVNQTDVLLLVPQSVGVAAVKRIVVDRFAKPRASVQALRSALRRPVRIRRRPLHLPATPGAQERNAPRRNPSGRARPVVRGER